MSTVYIRKRKGKDNKTYLNLEFNPPYFNPQTKKTSRYEFLHIYIYTNPQTSLQRTYNAEMMQLAENIRCQRVISITSADNGIFDKFNLKRDFLAYFKQKADKKNKSWHFALKYFTQFMHGKCTFGNLTVKLAEDFQEYLLTADVQNPTYKNTVKLNQNTASKYFCIFRRILKDAYREHMIKLNINDFLDNIPHKSTYKPYLTMDEVKRLYETPTKYYPLRNAVFFSIFTGLRLSDICDLNWNDIITAQDGKPCIYKRIIKTDEYKTIFISDEALEFCGTRRENCLVFPLFSRSMTKEPLKQWLRDAGIEKHITFHSFRHTNATLMSAAGIDIYTVMGQLTHAHVKTTEIYAKLVDSRRRLASEVISLKR